MKKNGFSFIEVMIAILVLAIGCEMLINLFPACFLYLGKSRIITNATFLCQSRLEEFLTEDYKDPAPPDETFTGYSDYSYHVEKTPFNEKLKEIKVSVYHGSGESKVIAAEFSTLQGGSGVGDIVEVELLDSFPLSGNTAVRFDSFFSSGLYAFSSDPKNGKIQFVRINGGLNSFNDGSPRQEWRKLKDYWNQSEDAVLPEGGIPGRISVTQIKKYTIMGSFPTIVYCPPQIFVYDIRNKCIWGGFLVAPGGYPAGNLFVIGATMGSDPDFNKTWVKVSQLP